MGLDLIPRLAEQVAVCGLEGGGSEVPGAGSDQTFHAESLLEDRSKQKKQKVKEGEFPDQLLSLLKNCIEDRRKIEMRQRQVQIEGVTVTVNVNLDRRNWSDESL